VLRKLRTEAASAICESSWGSSLFVETRGKGDAESVVRLKLGVVNCRTRTIVCASFYLSA
jgi:hypothetical protein